MAGTALKRLMAEYKREWRSLGPSRCLPGGIAPRALEGPRPGRGRDGRGAGQAAGLLWRPGRPLFTLSPRRLQGPVCVRTELPGAGVRGTGRYGALPPLRRLWEGDPACSLPSGRPWLQDLKQGESGNSGRVASYLDVFPC